MCYRLHQGVPCDLEGTIIHSPVAHPTISCQDLIYSTFALIKPYDLVVIKLTMHSTIQSVHHLANLSPQPWAVLARYLVILCIVNFNTYPEQARSRSQQRQGRGSI